MIDALKKIISADRVSVGDDYCASYSRDASGLEGKALAVVYPISTKEVQDIVRFADRHKTTIMPRGAGSSLCGGAVPENAIVLDFSQMNRIGPVVDKTIVVEPGVVVDELNTVLRNHQLFFPVIPSSHAVCEIGGMIATNAVGVRAVKYGRTQDWILELEVVDGLGRVGIIKNEKGIREICGTEGTVVIITKAKLKLTDYFEKTSVTLYRFSKVDELIKAMKKTKLNENVLAVEFINRECAKLAKLENQNYLIVEYEGDQGETKDLKSIANIWAMRDTLGPVLTSQGFTIMEDPMVSLEQMTALLQWIEQNAIPAFGHIGVGIVHPRFRQGEEDLIKEMFHLVQKLGGEVSGEHGYGIAKKQYVNSALHDRITNLKKNYDPYNILNKGKIIDGI